MKQQRFTWSIEQYHHLKSPYLYLDTLHANTSTKWFYPCGFFLFSPNMKSALHGNKPIFTGKFMFIQNTRDFVALSFKMKETVKRWKSIYSFYILNVHLRYLPSCPFWASPQEVQSHWELGSCARTGVPTWLQIQVHCVCAWGKCMFHMWNQ